MFLYLYDRHHYLFCYFFEMNYTTATSSTYILTLPMFIIINFASLYSNRIQNCIHTNKYIQIVPCERHYIILFLIISIFKIIKK